MGFRTQGLQWGCEYKVFSVFCDAGEKNTMFYSVWHSALQWGWEDQGLSVRVLIPCFAVWVSELCVSQFGFKDSMLYSANVRTIFCSAGAKTLVLQCVTQSFTVRVKRSRFVSAGVRTQFFQCWLHDSMFYSRGVTTPWFTVRDSVFYSAGVRTLCFTVCNSVFYNEDVSTPWFRVHDSVFYSVGVRTPWFTVHDSMFYTLQIILDLCIPEKELAKTRSQISFI